MKFEELHKAVPEEGTKCKAGCGKCCVAGAPVAKPETEEISEWLCKTYEYEQIRDQFHHHDTQPQMCPFLTPDKRCFIYPVRPVVCRLFGHLVGPAQMPKHLLQECPEGVGFTRISMLNILSQIGEWYQEAAAAYVQIGEFRLAELTAEDGTSGPIPKGGAARL